MLSDRDYMRPASRGGAGSFHWPHSAVVTLIFLTVAASALAGLLNINHDLWLARSELDGVGWLRLVTSLFIHGGVMHLLLNMYGLYLFGRDTETLLGPRRFVILYFLSGVAGNVAFVLVNPHAAALGASGCVFGVAAAAMLLTPNQRLMLLLPPVPLRMRTMVMIYVVLEVVFLVTGTQSGVAHLAHLGGFAAGFGYVKLVLWQRHGFAWSGGLGRRRAPGSPAGWSILDDATPPEAPPAPRHEPSPLRREPPLNPAPRREPRVVPATALSDEEISREIDPILDKIGQTGMASLTRRERDILDRARERLKGRS